MIMNKSEATAAPQLQIPETPFEKERRERNEAICKEFQELTPQVVAQGYKPYRAIKMIGDKYGMSHAGVIFVLKAAGLYTNSDEYLQSIQNAEAEHAEAAQS